MRAPPLSCRAPLYMLLALPQLAARKNQRVCSVEASDCVDRQWLAVRK